MQLAKQLAESTIDTYTAIVQAAMDARPLASVTDEEWAAQLQYHSLYLFQVLTLDRGTTHGLLAHSENDVGTLASLPGVLILYCTRTVLILYSCLCPGAIDRPLLEEWLRLLQKDENSMYQPQDQLLQKVINVPSHTPLSYFPLIPPSNPPLS
jgi:coproporphyrinogen III oxidase